MTISFSGLASGLDTSSWVESLVALKRAKVTSLEEQKTDVTISKDTLSSIKSFFTSFRSMLSKITESKFGNLNTDIFAQKLATSSDVGKLTATATSSAKEGTYNIQIDKLASETEVKSRFSYMTVYTVTTTANTTSKLSSLGVSAGDISVSVNGTPNIISLTENETIATFIDKLRGIGVEAYYNKDSGVFSINVDDDDIEDVGNTHIKERLSLTGVNEGYTGNYLTTVTEETVYSAAQGTTKLVDIGATAGQSTVFEANGQSATLSVTDSTSINDLINFLDTNLGVQADFDELTGILSMEDVHINELTDGAHIIDALGFDIDIFSKTQHTNDLSHYQTVTTSSTATSDTLITDIGLGTDVSEGGDTIMVKNADGNTIIVNVTRADTIGSVLANLTDAGLFATIRADGTVEISGGEILTGGTFDVLGAFGLQSEPYTATSTGKPLTEVVVTQHIVDLQTRLVEDLGVTRGYLEITDPDENKFYEKIYSGMTIADLMADLGNLGIYTDLDLETGVLSITGGEFKTLTNQEVLDLCDETVIVEPDDDLKRGTNLLTCLGLDVEAQQSVNASHSRSMALTRSVTETFDATGTTSLDKIGLSAGTATFSVRGDTRNVAITNEDTIDTFIDKLGDVGIEAEYDTDTNRIEINNAVLSSAGTTNMDSIFAEGETVSCRYVTSSALSACTTVVIDATSETTLSELGLGSINKWMKVYDSEGNVAGSFQVTGTTTLGGIVDSINTVGASNNVVAALTDGVMRITGGFISEELTASELTTPGSYAKGELLETLGFDITNKSSYVLGSVMSTTATVTDTIAKTTTSSTAITYDQTHIADENSVISDYVALPANKNIVVHSQTGDAIGTVAVNNTMTFGELFSSLSAYGIDGDIHDGVIMFSSDDHKYVTGDILANMGMSTEYTTTTVTTTVGISQTLEQKTYTQTEIADDTSVINDFITISASNNKIVVHDENGAATATVTVNDTMSFGDLFATLASYGVDGDIHNGQVTLIHNNGGYVDGSFTGANGLNMTTNLETIVTTTTAGMTSTSQLHTFQENEYANDESVINDFITINESNNKLVVHDGEGTNLGTITVTNTMKFGELFATLAGYGVDGDIHNGQVTLLQNDGGYVDGSFTGANGLGMTTSYSTVTSSHTIGTQTSGGLKTYTQTEIANDESIINDYITISGSNNKLVVHDEDGNATATVTVTNTMSFGDLFAQLAQYGVDGDIENGQVTFVHGNGGFVDGSFTGASGLNLTTNYETVTTIKTVGSTTTGTGFSYTGTFAADESTTFEQIGINSNQTYVINRSSTGESNLTFTVTKDNTIGEWFANLAEYGIDGDIHDGSILLQSDTGHYITGALATTLGIGTYESVQTSHASTTNDITTTGTFTVDVTTTQTINATGTTTISITQTLTVDVTSTQTITALSTMTIDVSDTIAIDLTQTYTVDSTGTFVVGGTETMTVNVTQTQTITSTGTTTITVENTVTINMTQTITPEMGTVTYTVNVASDFVNNITRIDTSTIADIKTLGNITESTTGTYKVTDTTGLRMLEGKTIGQLDIILANDIDLGGSWESIDLFEGSFNGNGYTISNSDNSFIDTIGHDAWIQNTKFSNFNINNERANVDVGVIARYAENGYHANDIRNIVVENCQISGDFRNGGFILGSCTDYESNTNITGCVVKNSNISSDESSAIGGIVGYSDCHSMYIEQCKVVNTHFDNSNGEYCGDFIGYADSPFEIWESISYLNEHYGYSACLVGFVSNDAGGYISDCGITVDINSNPHSSIDFAYLCHNSGDDPDTIDNVTFDEVYVYTNDTSYGISDVHNESYDSFYNLVSHNSLGSSHAPVFNGKIKEVITVNSGEPQTITVTDTQVITIPVESVVTVSMSQTITPENGTVTYTVNVASDFVSNINRIDTSTINDIKTLGDITNMTSGTFKVTDTEGLRKLEGKTIGQNMTVILANDINLGGSWNSIGSFAGTFNGNGYTISNSNNSFIDAAWDTAGISNIRYSDFNITATGDSSCGILANEFLGDQCTISNIVIDNSHISGDVRSGGFIVGYSEAETYITGCIVENSEISGNAYSNIGGIAGHINIEYFEILDCTVINTSFGEVISSGDIIGEIASGVIFEISNCNSYLNEHSLNNSGIVGYIANGAEGFIDHSSITVNLDENVFDSSTFAYICHYEDSATLDDIDMSGIDIYTNINSVCDVINCDDDSTNNFFLHSSVESNQPPEFHGSIREVITIDSTEPQTITITDTQVITIPVATFETIVNTVTETAIISASSDFLSEVQRVDTSTIQSIQDVHDLTHGGVAKISTAEDLLSFQTFLSSGTLDSSTTIYLANNINMSAVNWTGMNLICNFNGNGYTISNLNSALFDEVSGSISNLEIASSNINDTGDTGILANTLNDGSITNCVVKNSMIQYYSDDGESVGAVVGNITSSYCASIDSCKSVSNTVVYCQYTNQLPNNVGGIAGLANGRCDITNCISEGCNISSMYSATRDGDYDNNSSSYVGGIVGYVENHNTSAELVSNINNNYSINYHLSGGKLGGIIGKTSAGQGGITLVYCQDNIVDDRGNTQDYAAGGKYCYLCTAHEGSAGINTDGNAVYSYNYTIADFNTNSSIATHYNNTYGILPSGAAITQVNDVPTTIVNVGTEYQTQTITLSDTATIYPTTVEPITINVSQTLTIASTQTQTINVSDTIVIHPTAVEPITIDVTQTLTIASTQTQTIESTATTTVNLTQTLTIDTSQTITADASGTVTINVQYTQTIHGTQTATVESTGTVTVGIQQTVTIDATDTVTVGAVGTVTLNVQQTVTIESTDTITINIDATRTITANDTSDRKTYTVTTSMNADTTLADLEKAAGDAVVNYHGVDYTIHMGTHNTMGEFISALAAYGIQGSISADGKLSLQGTTEGYLKTLSGGLAELGLAQNNYTTNTITAVHGTNGASSPYSQTVTMTMNGSTTLDDLSLGAGGISGIHDGNAFTVTFGASSTIDGICAQLAAYGIEAYVQNGVMTFSGQDGSYITTVTGSAASLGAQNNSYTSNSSTLIQGSTTAGEAQSREVTHTMIGSDTLGTYISGASYSSVEGVHNGNTFTIDINPDTTFDELCTQLAAYGIQAYVQDGRFTYVGQEGSYLTSIGSLTALGNLTTAYSSSTSTVIHGVTTAGEEQSRTVTHAMDSSTTFADLGYYRPIFSISGAGTSPSDYHIIGMNPESATLTVVHQGTTATITMTSDNTVGDFMTALAGYGISSEIHDGVMTVRGSSDSYIKEASGFFVFDADYTGTGFSYNAFCFDFLWGGFSVTTSTTTVGENSTSTQRTLDVTHTMDTSTSFANLALEGEGTITVLQNGTQFVVTVDSSKTIDDMISTLAGYGISGEVNAGKISLSGADGSFILGISDNLKTTLKINSGLNNTYTTSTREIVSYMNDNTDLLSEYGVTRGNILISQDGDTYTVNFQGTTLGDFRSLLAGYGFTTRVTNDGRLEISGNGDSFIATLGGGSNIITQLGLSDWSRGKLTQTSDELSDTQTITGLATMGRALSELTDAEGVSIGITAGEQENIYIYRDGTRYDATIRGTDTLADLQAMLNTYGISMELSDTNGRLTLQGDGNTYIASQGGLGNGTILQKLGIDSWLTENNTTSDNLEYSVTSNKTMNRSTRLLDLQDSEGTNLGITTGTYYVYENGVRSTETITSDMTVNDLMASLATHGLIADIAEDGSIALGSNSNSYLGSSAMLMGNSNIVSTLFSEWDFTRIYDSNHLEVPTPETVAITRTTKLSDFNTESTGGTVFQAGTYVVTQNGVQTTLSLTADDTVGTFIDEIAMFGFETVINDNGQLIVHNTGDSTISSVDGGTNVLSLLGLDEWNTTSTYEGQVADPTTITTNLVSATRSTMMNELGVNTGEYNIFSNGVKYTAFISSDETLGSFIDTLRSFGIEASLVDNAGGTASVLTLNGHGDTYIAKSVNASGLTDEEMGISNIMSIFSNEIGQTEEFVSSKQIEGTITTTVTATGTTTIKELENWYDDDNISGYISVNVNDVNTKIAINDSDTIDDVLNKFRALGVEAMLADGKIAIHSGFNTFTINEIGTTSSLGKIFSESNKVGLTYSDDLGGYAMTSAGSTVLSTTTVTEERTLSAAKYADMDTKLSLLNVSTGRMNVYRDGQKGTIEIEENETFTTLNNKLKAAFAGHSDDVTLHFDSDGYLIIESAAGAQINIGSSTDTTNFASVNGIHTEDKNAVSARSLYCVNNDSKVTTNGIFRTRTINDVETTQVTTGSFIVGTEQITIDENTTLDDIISQINNSEKTRALAYWDTVKGELIITSRDTGAQFVNIEAGDTNFTDMMGLTKNIGGQSAIDTATQNVGSNARFKINGTTYTSSSNSIDSSISRLTGVTFNLKEVTEGESIKLVVEKDKETVANAVSDVVDAYNTLMQNVDEAIAKDGNLSNQTTLKMIRNQLRNLMTSSFASGTEFKNLSALGISTSAASGNNISVTNDAIVDLFFDKDKFLSAFNSSDSAVRALLVGADGASGLFNSVESLIQNSLEGAGNYFEAAEKSYNTQINQLNEKIKKANQDIINYRARLESKFKAMDSLIAKMNQQYSSFLQS